MSKRAIFRLVRPRSDINPRALAHHAMSTGEACPEPGGEAEGYGTRCQDGRALGPRTHGFADSVRDSRGVYTRGSTRWMCFRSWVARSAACAGGHGWIGPAPARPGSTVGQHVVTAAGISATVPATGRTSPTFSPLMRLYRGRALAIGTAGRRTVLMTDREFAMGNTPGTPVCRWAVRLERAQAIATAGRRWQCARSVAP
jgi:hypothetical protein